MFSYFEELYTCLATFSQIRDSHFGLRLAHQLFIEDRHTSAYRRLNCVVFKRNTMLLPPNFKVKGFEKLYQNTIVSEQLHPLSINTVHPEATCYQSHRNCTQPLPIRIYVLFTFLMCAYTYTCIIYVNIYVCICLHACVSVYMYMYMYVCISICTRMTTWNQHHRQYCF